MDFRQDFIDQIQQQGSLEIKIRFCIFHYSLNQRIVEDKINYIKKYSFITKSMQHISQKQQLSSSKGDFFESAPLSKGFFYHNEEEETPEETYQNVDNSSKGNQRLSQPSQPLASRRRRNQTSTPQQASQKSTTQNLSVVKQQKPYKRTAKRKFNSSQQRLVEALDDEWMIIHDQIVFSKTLDYEGGKHDEVKQQDCYKNERKQQKYQKCNEGLFVFDQNEENEDNQKNDDRELIVQKENPSLKASKPQIVFQRSDKSSQDQLCQKNQTPHQDNHQQATFNKIQQQKQNKFFAPIKYTDQNYTSHMIKILSSPIQQNMTMKTNIVRNSGFFNLHPEYHVYYQNDQTYLMSAKKVSRTPFSTFVISRNKKDYEQNSPQYLGKAKCSAMGDQLDLYGPGLSPSNAFTQDTKPRQLVATVVYETRIIQSGLPRDFTVYVKKPEVDYYGSFSEIKMYGDEISLNVLYQNPHNRDKIIVFKNRKPQYTHQIRGYSLNFQGRVGVASVKNFILDNVVKTQGVKKKIPIAKEPSAAPLLFGKVKENIFNMDIGSPLSPFIAFGIVLASFDQKYFCE